MEEREIPLIDDVRDKLLHNSYVEALDLLLEEDKLELILQCPELDDTIFNKICLYLVRTSTYESDLEDSEKILNVIYKICMQFKNYSKALIYALKLNSHEKISEVFNSAVDNDSKLQLAMILGKMSYFAYESDDETLCLLMGNMKRSDYYHQVGKDLEILEVKTPEDIYKTHLADVYSVNNLRNTETSIQSAKDNLMSTFVSAFVNAGYCSNSLIEDPRNVNHPSMNKDMGLLLSVASIGMLYQWNINEGLGKLDPYLSSTNLFMQSGAALGIGINAAGTFAAEQITLQYYQDLFQSGVSKNQPLLLLCTILSLGLTTAGSRKIETYNYLKQFVDENSVNVPHDVGCFACLSLGLCYVGSRKDYILNIVLDKYMSLTPEQCGNPISILILLSLGLLFLGTQENCNAILESLDIMESPLTKSAKIIIKSFAYVSSGNQLTVQSLLRECADHIKENTPHQTAAVIGIGMISMSDNITKEMSLRILDHCVQYGESSVRKAVPLAIAVLYTSEPEYSVVDTLSRFSHDGDKDVSINAIMALGIVGAGTNNSKIAIILRQLSVYYKVDLDRLFIVRIAQGLLHMGKGMLSLNPSHYDNLLYNPVNMGSLLALLYCCTDYKKLLIDQYPFLFYVISPAMHPKYVVCVDSTLEHIPVDVRVGQIVDTVGQAGNPRTISGFQTHKTPVLLNAHEKSELANDDFVSMIDDLEDIVVVKKP